MSYDVHARTQFSHLELREVIQSKPDILLGVSPEAAATLDSMRIRTVYDLALSSLFGSAARIVAAAADSDSVLARHGTPSSDLMVPASATDTISQLPGEPVQTLVGISAALATAMADTMAVTSIRDLAQWPPYLAAVKLVTEALAPDRAAGYDRDDPPDLLPRTGAQATHNVRYTSVVLIKSKPSSSHAWDGGLIDVTALSQVGFNDVALGAILHFNQTWAPKAVALGQLLHSLPLAPGESTRLTVVDWLRRVAATTTEDESQTESLANALSNTTGITEVTNAVAQEFQSGDSVAGSSSVTTGGSTPGLLGLLGGSVSGGSSVGVAGTYSTSSGLRSVSASAVQSIDARTQQNAALNRTKRAAIVSEVSQSDSETINTRVVVNNNHMHAMSVQYYEVVQTWQTEVVLDTIERCMFIPMRLVNFRSEQILRRYLPILVNAARDRATRDLLLRLRHTVVLELPSDRFATAALAQIAEEASAEAAAQSAALPADPDKHGVALKAAIEKRLAVQQVQGWVQVLRSALRDQADALVQSGAAEAFDLDGLQRIEIDRQALITNVAWDDGITAVTIGFADGHLARLSESGDRSAVGQVNAGLGTAGFTIEQLDSLSVSVSAQAGANPSDYSIQRLWLQIQQPGRSFWLDLSFVVSRAHAADLIVLRAHPPVDVNEVADRLMADQLYYSQAIWMRADRQSLIMQLTPYVYEIDGQTIRVVEWLDPVPVTVAGNYVAFRFTYEADKDWKTWVRRERAAARPQVSLVPLPTGGVFAEAVLGEFNAAEKLDATRFWKWEESPIPNLAPEIAAAQQGQHTAIGAPAVTALPDAVLSLQSPLALPALAGSDALLKTLMVNKLFNDMSGAEITKGLLDASVQASRDGDLAAAKQATDTLNAITSAFSKLVASGTDGGQNMMNTLKGLGSMFNLSGQGNGKDGKTGQDGAGNAAGQVVNVATSEGGASGLGDLVAGDGATTVASVGGDLGTVLDAVGPVAAALLA